MTRKRGKCRVKIQPAPKRVFYSHGDASEDGDGGTYYCTRCDVFATRGHFIVDAVHSARTHAACHARSRKAWVEIVRSGARFRRARGGSVWHG